MSMRRPSVRRPRGGRPRRCRRRRAGRLRRRRRRADPARAASDLKAALDAVEAAVDGRRLRRGPRPLSQVRGDRCSTSPPTSTRTSRAPAGGRRQPRPARHRACGEGAQPEETAAHDDARRAGGHRRETTRRDRHRRGDDPAETETARTRRPPTPAHRRRSRRRPPRPARRRRTGGAAPAPEETADDGGQLIAGRYELGERLGVGGMSTVVLAFDRRLEREVAVKLLAEHLADDRQFVTRFRREALAAARLVHPNIVQVFDFGLDEATGRHFIVMEYVRGRSGAGAPPRRGPAELGAARWRSSTQGCRGPGLRPPPRRRAPRRQARQPAARRGRDGQARRLRHRQGAASSRRSPRSARCWAPPPTSRPSRPTASRPARRPTSTRSAS